VNHLAHLALAGDDDGLLVGGFLGDFVKGRLRGERRVEIERGIRLHRLIDHFTDHHPTVRELRQGFPEETRRVAGIALDLMFDHQLAVAFETFYPEPLDTFEQTTFTRLLNPEYLADYPPAALAQCRAMSARSSLQKTADSDFVCRSLTWIRTRLHQGETLLADSIIEQIHGLEPVILPHFVSFYTELKAEVGRTIRSFSHEASNNTL
jgi:acyl carrier protein phosphodiesterase